MQDSFERQLETERASGSEVLYVCWKTFGTILQSMPADFHPGPQLGSRSPRANMYSMSSLTVSGKEEREKLQIINTICTIAIIQILFLSFWQPSVLHLGHMPHFPPPQTSRSPALTSCMQEALFCLYKDSYLTDAQFAVHISHDVAARH